MLKEFLCKAASQYEATGHKDAKLVARLLRQTSVPGNWRTNGHKPHQPALANALAASDSLPITAPLAKITDHLSWNNSNSLRKAPEHLIGDYCFTAIVGPNDLPGNLIDRDLFRFGVYLQTPHTFYPSHKHEAVELYLPISGTAHWQKDDQPFAAVKPGTLIHHKTYQPHATKTDKEPMLALWAWLGNLSTDTYSFVSG